MARLFDWMKPSALTLSKYCKSKKPWYINLDNRACCEVASRMPTQVQMWEVTSRMNNQGSYSEPRQTHTVANWWGSLFWKEQLNTQYAIKGSYVNHFNTVSVSVNSKVFWCFDQNRSVKQSNDFWVVLWLWKCSTGFRPSLGIWKNRANARWAGPSQLLKIFVYQNVYFKKFCCSAAHAEAANYSTYELTRSQTDNLLAIIFLGMRTDMPSTPFKLIYRSMHVESGQKETWKKRHRNNPSASANYMYTC